jgi:hypothetical protein
MSRLARVASSLQQVARAASPHARCIGSAADTGAQFLDDVVVLELASVLAGPTVGQFLAELGATVIKVGSTHPLTRCTARQ